MSAQFFSPIVSMPERRSLEERIEMVCLYARLQNYNAVRREWMQRFSTTPPKQETIQAVFNRFRETGSVEDRHRSGRPSTATSESKEEEAMSLVQANPKTSVRQGAVTLDISIRSYRRLMHQLNLRPFRAQHVPALNDTDFDCRVEFCEIMLERFAEDDQLIDKIVWSDESQFRLDGTVNRHNDIVWASNNPHRQVEVPHSQQSVMVWCGLSSQGLIGPHFFDGSVNSESYLNVLETVVWPAVRRRGLTFQQDGAPAHYSLRVRQWLEKKFPGRWIGRRGPINWPPRSPDLTPCDYFLWGWMKERVYRDRATSTAQLRELIRTACSELSADMCQDVCRSASQRFQQCCDREGAQLVE